MSTITAHQSHAITFLRDHLPVSVYVHPNFSLSRQIKGIHDPDGARDIITGLDNPIDKSAASGAEAVLYVMPGLVEKNCSDAGGSLKDVEDGSCSLTPGCNHLIAVLGTAKSM